MLGIQRIVFFLLAGFMLFSLGARRSLAEGSGVIPLFTYAGDVLPSADGWTIKNYPSYEATGARVEDGVLHFIDNHSWGGSAIHYQKAWDTAPGYVNIAEFVVKGRSCGGNGTDGGYGCIYFGSSDGDYNMIYTVYPDRIVSSFLENGSLSLPGSLGESYYFDTATAFNTYKTVIVDGQARLYINDNLVMEQPAGKGIYDVKGAEFGAGSSPATGEAYFDEVRAYRIPKEGNLVLFDDFSANSGLCTYKGMAYRDAVNGYVVLTNPRGWTWGQVWCTPGVTGPFQASFRYRAGGGSGADGFVFMFYKKPDYSPDLGGSLGFTIPPHGSFLPVPGYGVEFDNYCNGWFDPSCNHVALIQNTVRNNLAIVNDGRTEDNKWHDVVVIVGESSIQVFLDEQQLISWTGNIDRTYSGFGFTAATGAATNWHIIDNLALVDLSNKLPQASAGPDRTIECSGPGGSTITLDGSGSSDPDGDALTYTWTWPGGSAAGASPTITLPYGETAVTLTVDDGKGGTATDELLVTVQDSTPPTTTSSVAGVAGQNGWYVSDVSVTLNATDTCTGVREIHYTVNGTETVIGGNTAGFTLDADGSYLVTYWAVDNAGREGAHGSASISREAAPPVTTPGVPPPPPDGNGYYRTCVPVSLDAAAGVSGVSGTEYSVDGGMTWLDYTGPFSVCGDGETTITYRTTSNAGNVEQPGTLVINIDTTPPVITASVGPAPNANGWHNTDVTVTFTCSDILSGIDSCPGPSMVATQGAGQVITGTAKDKAGNAATASVTLNIDTTAPAADLSVAPGILWPPNHKMVDVLVSGASTDATSGVASVVFTVTDEYGMVQPEISGFNTTIPLEAWREGTDRDGRHYTITAVVTDTAGNTTTVTTEAVCPHDMRDKK